MFFYSAVEIFPSNRPTVQQKSPMPKLSVGMGRRCDKGGELPPESYSLSAARRIRSERSHNAPLSCSFSASLNPLGLPFPSMPSIL